MTNKTLKQRVSVGFDKDTYENLTTIADENDVSIAWVIRYAVQSFFRERDAGKKQQLILPFGNPET